MKFLVSKEGGGEEGDPFKLPIPDIEVNQSFIPEVFETGFP